MKDFIVYVALSCICLALFVIVYKIFLRGNKDFIFNRIYLIVGLILSFVLPTIRLTYQVTITHVDKVALSQTQLVDKEIDGINIWYILFSIYILGVLILLVRNMLSYRKLTKIIKKGQRIVFDQYTMIDSSAIKSPFSFLRFVVINRQKLSDTEQNIIIKHEITHVKQKHWVDLLCSECALVMQWFNPFMWLYVYLQKENHEFLADKAVLNQGISPTLYQAALINQSIDSSVFSLTNSFYYSNNLNRLTMMKKNTTSQWRRAAILTLIPAFGLFFWTSAEPVYILQTEYTESNISNDNISISPKLDDNSLGLQEEIPAPKILDLKKYQGLVFIDGKKSTINELIDLPANKIEIMDVLKGETATDAYGVKGRDGVILITTKK